MRAWLYVGAKVTPKNPNPAWAELISGQAFVAPIYGRVYIVTAIGAFIDMVAIQLAGMPKDTGYDADSFVPVLPDTTSTVEALKRSVNDAVKRGEPVRA